MTDKYENPTPLPVEKCNPEVNFKYSDRYKEIVQLQAEFNLDFGLMCASQEIQFQGNAFSNV